MGNEGSAASGGYSDPSEWQRSIKSRKSGKPEDFIGHRNRVNSPLTKMFVKKEKDIL